MLRFTMSKSKMITLSWKNFKPILKKETGENEQKELENSILCTGEK